MSHLILKILTSPASVIAGLSGKPRPIVGGIGASRAADNALPRRQ